MNNKIQIILYMNNKAQLVLPNIMHSIRTRYVK